MYGFLHRRCVLLSVRLKDPSTKIRNIGVIAHIDAGKTTTTERFLFYSGQLKDARAPGGVDAGSTVTDFLEEERKRGITIQAAAVSFAWPSPRQLDRTASLIPAYPSIAHDPTPVVTPSSAPLSTTAAAAATESFTLNLIDTPGHADFVFEVRRALAVLDGAVVVLDTSRGVQAQTYAVFGAAKRRGVRTIGFFNKCDKAGADVAQCAASVTGRLGVTPVLLTLPLYSEAVRTDSGSAGSSMHIGRGRLIGVVDILSSLVYVFDATTAGAAVATAPLSVVLTAAGGADSSTTATQARTVLNALGFPSSLFDGDGVFGSVEAAQRAADTFSSARQAALDGLTGAAEGIDAFLREGGRAAVAAAEDTTIKVPPARPAVWDAEAHGALSDALLEGVFEFDESVAQVRDGGEGAKDALPKEWKDATKAVAHRAASAGAPPIAADANGGTGEGGARGTAHARNAAALEAASLSAFTQWPAVAPLPPQLQKMVLASVRAGMASGTVLPCFCGASARNIGVQSVLDAVLALLPPPAVARATAMSLTRTSPSGATSTASAPPSAQSAPAGEGDAKARVAASVVDAPPDSRAVLFCFKVSALAGADHLEGGGQASNKSSSGTAATAPPVHTYVRVYSGSIKRSSVLRNLSAEKRAVAGGLPAKTARARCEEKCGGLFKVFGKTLLAVDSLQAGDVGVVAGLSGVVTSDTLISAVDAKGIGGGGAGGGVSVADESVVPLTFDDGRVVPLPLEGVAPPPGMFIANVSAPSAQDRPLRVALDSLSREDPSIRVYDNDGPLRVGGLGRLHLEILSGRLARDFGLEPFFSRPTVSVYDTLATSSGLRCAWLNGDSFPIPAPKIASVSDGLLSSCASGVGIVYRVRPLSFAVGALDENSDAYLSDVAHVPLPTTSSKGVSEATAPRYVCLSAVGSAPPILLAGPAADPEDVVHSSAVAVVPLIALAVQAAARRSLRKRPLVGFAVDVLSVSPALSERLSTQSGGARGADPKAGGSTTARSLTSKLPDWYIAAIQTAIYNDIRRLLIGRPPLDRCPFVPGGDMETPPPLVCDLAKVPLTEKEDLEELEAVTPAAADDDEGPRKGGRTLLSSMRSKLAPPSAASGGASDGSAGERSADEGAVQEASAPHPVVGLHPVSLVTVTLVEESTLDQVKELLNQLGATLLHDMEASQGDAVDAAGGAAECELVAQLPASALPTLSERLPATSRGLGRYVAVPRWLERLEDDAETAQ